MLDKLNEEDKKKVIDKLNTYGYKNANDSFFETKDYENLRDTMFHELPSMPKLRSLRLYSIDSLLNFGKNFALDHTNNECSTKIKFNNNDFLRPINSRKISLYRRNFATMHRRTETKAIGFGLYQRLRNSYPKPKSFGRPYGIPYS